MAKLELWDEAGTTASFSPRAVALTGGNQAIANKPAFYVGFSIRETSGATGAVVRIFDNATVAAGTVLDEISLTAGESAREYYPLGGVKAANGIYVQVAGAVTGSVRTV